MGLMNFRWSFLLFGSFASHFQIKFSTHGSNLNSIFVIMAELKFFLLTGVLTQNMVACCSSLEKIGQMNFKYVLNKTLL
jgi:hypothetical protein